MTRKRSLKIKIRLPLLALFIAALAALVAFITATPAAAQETMLHSFNNNGKDGQDPFGGLVFDSSGNLYGTTLQGGVHGGGTVFELRPTTGGGWTETVLHSFGNGSDGFLLYSGLILDVSGNLYGTTYWGGKYAYGTVFELTPTGGGNWTEKILHSFAFNGTDGTNPVAGLIFDASGNLYGTTSGGGAYGGGIVFELTPAANGSWDEKILHNFNNNGTDGNNPLAGLIFDASGNLYGTTLDGPYDIGVNYLGGTVFELTPSTDGSWTETVLYNFDGIGTNPYDPDAGLIFDSAGNLYSTTPQGGAGPNDGDGTVFKLSPQAGGGWTEAVLHSFGNGTDGLNPSAGLIIDASGNLYGTTWQGGPYGSGTAFELMPEAGTVWAEKILYSFNEGATDGKHPSAGLIFDASGNLYGTTQGGGVYGSGTVFKINPRLMPTTTALVSSPNPAAPYKVVTYTAAVTAQDGEDVTGTVAFQDGDSTFATVPVANNQAAYSIAYKKGGVHAIAAVYSGDSTYANSISATLTEYVEIDVSKTALATSGSPSQIGQPVTFTATVTSKKGTIPNGELVTFYDGKMVLGSVALTGGAAAYTTSALSAKTHDIKAAYAGDEVYEPSSDTVTQFVDKYATTTSLNSSLNPSQFGQAVTFTAQVTSSGPTPTGKVKFLDGTTAIGLATLNGGVATLTKSKLTVGTHLITAEYSGNADNAKATSSVLDQVVQ
jgi:uncharacterized repeat protein (TIGR03803 family)